MTAPASRAPSSDAHAELSACKAKMDKILDYWTARCNSLLARWNRAESDFEQQVLADKFDAAAAQRNAAYDALKKLS